MSLIDGKKIVEGIWATADKKRVAILLEDEQGGKNSIQAHEGDTNWDLFFTVFNPDQVTMFTEKRQKNIADDRKRQEKIKEEQKQVNVKMQQLFQAKLEAFEIEAVQKSENREMRSRIRRAKSLTEVYAQAAALIISEMNNDTK